MKNLKTITQILFIILTFSFVVSCSGDDDDDSQGPAPTPVPTVEVPTITLTQPEIETVCFKSGSALPYSINWNGEQGSLDLVNDISGLSIEANTGKLSWDRQLSLGTKEITVIATNSAGNTQKNITINNPFQGVFTGTYTEFTQNYFQFEFIPDGTLIARINDPNDPDLGTGTWTRNNLEIVADFVLSGDQQLSLKGDLDIDATDVLYSGVLYNEYGARGYEIGPFEMTLE